MVTWLLNRLVQESDRKQANNGPVIYFFALSFKAPACYKTSHSCFSAAATITTVPPSRDRLTAKTLANATNAVTSLTSRSIPKYKMAPGRDKTELLPTMTVRDIEIAVYGWRAVGDDGKVRSSYPIIYHSSYQSFPCILPALDTCFVCLESLPLLSFFHPGSHNFTLFTSHSFWLRVKSSYLQSPLFLPFCFSSQMDYTKLAQMCKFGSIASARTCWSSVKKKLNALEPLSGGTTSAATAAAAPNKGKAATSKKREAASSTAAADIKHELLQSDEYVDLAVTGKKTRPGPKKAQVVKDEDQVDGDGAETSSIKDSSE